MEKVLMGPELFACMRADTNEESMPPDRKAPMGTSDNILERTAS